MIRITGALFFVLCLTSIAEARGRAHYAHPDCNVLFPCEGVVSSSRGEMVVKAMGGLGSARKIYAPRASGAAVRGYVTGLVGALAGKVAEIQASCGAKVISGVRHTYIAGTRRVSLHASGKAVDMTGNPSCIYGALQGWSGGYSVDYARMRHIHISYDPDGGREMGLHFRHGGHRHAARHHHRNHRYVSVR